MAEEVLLLLITAGILVALAHTIAMRLYGQRATRTLVIHGLLVFCCFAAGLGYFSQGWLLWGIVSIAFGCVGGAILTTWLRGRRR